MRADRFRATHPYQELRSNGVAWSYLACGQGHKTLLFLPGGFVRADLWFHAITALEHGYRILALSASLETFDIADALAAFVALLDREQVDKAFVIGVSAGGGLAQYLLQSHPQLVEHLVLSHCTPLSPTTGRRLRRLLGLLQLLPEPLLRRLLIARTAHYPASPWAAFTRAFFRERLPEVSKAVFVRFFQSGADAALGFEYRREVVQEWPGRMLILTSNDDRTTYPHLGELQARYPRAETHIFERGGHHTLLLDPETYVATLKSFLDEL